MIFSNLNYRIFKDYYNSIDYRTLPNVYVLKVRLKTSSIGSILKDFYFEELKVIEMVILWHKHDSSVV